MLVGLTGGVASGKSTVCRGFAEHGVEIVDADIIARDVVAPESQGLQEIVNAFGPSVVDESGALRRDVLREIVFSNTAKRRELEAITHPRIRQALWQQAKAAKSPYVVLAVPLLIEGGLNHAVDRVAVVDVTEDVQRQRLAARDGSSEEQIEQMIAAQTSRQSRLSAADDIIDNSGPLTALQAQIDALHYRYRQLT